MPAEQIEEIKLREDVDYQNHPLFKEIVGISHFISIASGVAIADRPKLQVMLDDAMRALTIRDPLIPILLADREALQNRSIVAACLSEPSKKELNDKILGYTQSDVFSARLHRIIREVIGGDGMIVLEEYYKGSMLLIETPEDVEAMRAKIGIVQVLAAEALCEMAPGFKGEVRVDFGFSPLETIPADNPTQEDIEAVWINLLEAKFAQNMTRRRMRQVECDHERQRIPAQGLEGKKGENRTKIRERLAVEFYQGFSEILEEVLADYQATSDQLKTKKAWVKLFEIKKFEGEAFLIPRAEALVLEKKGELEEKTKTRKYAVFRDYLEILDISDVLKPFRLEGIKDYSDDVNEIVELLREGAEARGGTDQEIKDQLLSLLHQLEVSVKDEAIDGMPSKTKYAFYRHAIKSSDYLVSISDLQGFSALKNRALAVQAHKIAMHEYPPNQFGDLLLSLNDGGTVNIRNIQDALWDGVNIGLGSCEDDMDSHKLALFADGADGAIINRFVGEGGGDHGDTRFNITLDTDGGDEQRFIADIQGDTKALSLMKAIDHVSLVTRTRTASVLGLPRLPHIQDPNSLSDEAVASISAMVEALLWAESKHEELKAQEKKVASTIPSTRYGQFTAA